MWAKNPHIYIFHIELEICWTYNTRIHHSYKYKGPWLRSDLWSFMHRYTIDKAQWTYFAYKSFSNVTADYAYNEIHYD